MRAKNRSPKTINSYRPAVDQLIDHIGQKSADQITNADIEGFLAHFLETRASATTRQRCASLKQFFQWAAGEGEIPSDPMERITPRM